MAGVGRHGAGSMVKLSDGRYRVAVTMPDGRRVWRRARTLDEAKRDRRELVAAREADLDPSRLTLAEWLRSWLASLRDARHARIRPRTFEHYELIVERHILPALGQYRLDRLSERHVQAWLDADPAAPRTVGHHRAVLRRALNVALRQRMVGRNVALAIELPEPPPFRPAPLSAAECRLLFAVADRWSILWRLAVDSGLRLSELLAVGWDDLDLDAGVVTVGSQLQRESGTWVRAVPKAARTSERIYLTGPTVAALREHKVRQAADRRADWRYWGHVFLRPDGDPPHRTDLLRAFHAACLAAGIEPRRIHDLRSTADTLMAEAGVPEHVRMARLGHSTVTMARHYTVVRDELERDARDRLAGVLAG